MRVGLITGEYPPMQGGVGAFTRELARAMAGMGHQIHVFTRAAVTGADESGISVAPLVVGRWGWDTISQIRKWVAETRVEVVNIQFQTAAYDMHPAIHWLPGRLHYPVVVTFHDLRVPYLFPKAGPARGWIVRKLAHNADAAIATDREDEARLRNEWHVACVRWIPIGSNITVSLPTGYDRWALRAALGVGEDALLISYFGFLNESKGGLILIEALARLITWGIPAYVVMIGERVGSSDPTNTVYGQQVDALIRQYSLDEHVIWTGFLDDEGVSAHFYASDLSALPYLDGVSLRRGTLMAALAHGRAIVTTHPQTSAPELEGVVVTVPPGDADALAEAIRVLWKDPSRRMALEQAAKQASRHFSWKGIARQTIDFFQELIGSR